MDKQRCRFLLGACRPNGADATDPTFQAALEQTRTDPDLGAWFAREQAIDRAIAGKLLEVRAPAELRQQILSGLAVSSPFRGRRPVMTILAGLAAAASIALAIYVALPRRAPRPVDTIIASSVTTAAEHPALTYYASSLPELRTRLASDKAPSPGELPKPLAALTTVGCRSINWSGVNASLVSFRAPDFPVQTDGETRDVVLQLFTVDQRSCAAASASLTPVVFSRDNAAVATWRDARSYYVLVASVPEEALRRFLGTTANVAADLRYFERGSLRAHPVDV